MLIFPFLNLFCGILLCYCNYQNRAGMDEGFLWLSFYIYIYLVFFVLYLSAFCKLKYAICASVASSGS